MRRATAMMVGLAACTPQDGETGYVLVDPAARKAGVQVHVDDVAVEGLLPEAVDVGEALALSVPGHSPEELWVEPGTVLHVQGPNGRLEPWVLGVDIGAHEVVIDATDEAADELADQASAELEEVREGWRLTGHGLWAELAVVDVPDGLYETLPVSDLDLPGVVLGSPQNHESLQALPAEVLAWMNGTLTPPEVERQQDAASRRVDAAYDLASPGWVVAPEASDRAAAQWVGRYCRDGTTWSLDALGSALLDGEPQGRWRVDELGRVVLDDGRALRAVGDGIETGSGAVFADGVQGGCDEQAG